jgi:hypothetical protein
MSKARLLENAEVSALTPDSAHNCLGFFAESQGIFLKKRKAILPTTARTR